jgi:sugar O-acyltransferase (sialic acid O-acetyltransferase NeuD family)
MNQVILAGYSGHAFVAGDILLRSLFNIEGYLELQGKKSNPFNIPWLGNDADESVLNNLRNKKFFAAIGDNNVRRIIFHRLSSAGMISVNAIDPSAVVSASALLNGSGIMIGMNAVINALSQIGAGVICNTACVIEHECKVGNFVHIGPGAVLCGNVTVGENTFIGAGAVIKEGVIIGGGVTVGAGAIIIGNIENNSKVAGNPGRIL